MLWKSGWLKHASFAYEAFKFLMINYQETITCSSEKDNIHLKHIELNIVISSDTYQTKYAYQLFVYVILMLLLEAAILYC